MKLYIIEDDGYEVLTENELRDRCEYEATDEDFDFKPAPIDLSDKEAVKDWYKDFGNAREEHMKNNKIDFSGLTGPELVEEYQALSKRPFAEEVEIPDYSYIKTSKGYCVQRVVVEEVEVFKTREEAERYLETINGLTNKG